MPYWIIKMRQKNGNLLWRVASPGLNLSPFVSTFWCYLATFDSLWWGAGERLLASYLLHKLNSNHNVFETKKYNPINHNKWIITNSRKSSLNQIHWLKRLLKPLSILLQINCLRGIRSFVISKFLYAINNTIMVTTMRTLRRLVVVQHAFRYIVHDKKI